MDQSILMTALFAQMLPLYDLASRDLLEGTMASDQSTLIIAA